MYALDSTAGAFIDANGTAPYFDALEKYYRLIATFRARIAGLVDFERIEAREFWRRAVAEALRENDFDENPLIDAMFDPDSHGCSDENIDDAVAAHVALLDEMICRETDRDRLAAAAVMLAVSLGYSPAEVIVQP